MPPEHRTIFIVPREVLFALKQNNSPRVDCYSVGETSDDGEVIESPTAPRTQDVASATRGIWETLRLQIRHRMTSKRL